MNEGRANTLLSLAGLPSVGLVLALILVVVL
jgi:hypothetical protein